MQPLLTVCLFLATVGSCTAACPCGEVNFLVSDLLGYRVPSKFVHLNLDGHDYTTEVRERRLLKLPYGQYEVRIDVPGFNLWQRTVRVQNPNVIVPVGMETGEIEGKPELCSLQGQISETTSLFKLESIWVHVQAVFGDQSFSTLVQKHRFTIDQMPCGVYTIALIKDDHVVSLTTATFVKRYLSVTIR